MKARRTWLLGESELPRPEWGSLPPPVPLLVPIIVKASKSKNGKKRTVKPQVGLGSWQGSGQKEGAGQVSLPTPVCSSATSLPSGPNSSSGDGPASPPLCGLLDPGDEQPRRSAEHNDVDVAIYPPFQGLNYL